MSKKSRDANIFIISSSIALTAENSIENLVSSSGSSLLRTSYSGVEVAYEFSSIKEALL